MQKRLRKRLIALLCGVTLLFGLTGCKDKDITAYDIAVKNGFVGTEQEWLSSLHGANGEDGEDLDANALYEAAKANGSFSGTFLEFCKELNIEVPQYNDTKTIADNMLSCVSIYCGFTNVRTTNEQGIPTTVPFGYQGGSGVIVDLNKEGGNAYILTNYHVIYNPDSKQAGFSEDIWVYLCGANAEFEGRVNGERGDGMKASVYGGSMDYDIAILKVEGNTQLKTSNAKEATLGDSETVKVGEETYVIGNPSLQGMSVTNGILSVQSEYINIAALDNRDEDRDGQVDPVAYRVMRTSAAINSGNSGGGMFNTAGELIGIVNAKSSSSTVDNMGYALPISQVKKVCKNIRDNGGFVNRAYLGIQIDVVTSEAVEYEDSIKIVETFQVGSVELYSASRPNAWTSLLSVGDIFISATLNGTKTTFERYYQLKDFLLDVRQNDTVTFTIKDTYGREKNVNITFGASHFQEYR